MTVPRRYWEHGINVCDSFDLFSDIWYHYNEYQVNEHKNWTLLLLSAVMKLGRPIEIGLLN